MELSIDELNGYLFCPAQYDFKFQKKVPYDDIDSIKYRQAIHKTIYYFYFSLMGGWVPSAKQMKDKWASIWTETKNGKPNITEMLLKERGFNERNNPKGVDKYIVKGYELIHNFYYHNKENPGTPIAVDLEFRVPIAGVTVTGKFELIRELVDKTSQNRFIEIVDFKTGNEANDDFLIKNDLNFTIMSYAFRNLFNAEEDRLVFDYLKSGRKVYTYRDEKQYDRMKAIVEGVAEGIANQRFYPRQSFMCKTCPFKSACDIASF